MMDHYVWKDGQLRVKRMVALHWSLICVAGQTCLVILLLVSCFMLTSSPVGVNMSGQDCSTFNYSTDLLALRMRRETCVGQARTLPDVVVLGDRTGAIATLRYLSYLHPSVKSIGQTLHYYSLNDNDTLQLVSDIEHMQGYQCPGSLTIWAPSRYFDDQGLLVDIYKLNKHAKLIVALRDPIASANAEHQMTLHCQSRGCMGMSGHETVRIFSEMVNNTGFKPIHRSKYDVHLNQWLKVFPRRTMHFVDTNLLLVEPAFELKQIEDFLGLRNSIEKRMFTFNETRASMQICGLQLAAVYGHYQPPVEPFIQKNLIGQFAPHVQNLQRTMGQSLSWMQRYQVKVGRFI